MRKIIIIFVLAMAYGCASTSIKDVNFATANQTKIAVRSFDEFKSNRYYFLESAIIEDSQKTAIDDAIKTYHNALVETSNGFENGDFDRNSFNLKKTLAFYNYNEALKSILSTSQFELYQTKLPTDYNKQDEKVVINTLKANNYL